MSKMMPGKWRKAAILLLALALGCSYTQVGGTVRGETTTVYHESFASGKGAAVQSGGASLTQVGGKVFEGNDDGGALYVSNRVNNWDAADFKFADIGLENGKTYDIKVTGYVDLDVTVTTGAGAALQTDKTYAWLTGADFEAGRAFTLSKADYTVDSATDTALRIQSNEAGKTVPFYIGDILITEKTDSGGGEDPPRPPAEPFTPVTFEDQTAGGFVGRGGNEVLTVTDEANHTDGGAYSLKVEGRDKTWNGPSLRVEKYIDKGAEYKVTAWIRLVDPASSQLQLSTQVGDGSGASYVNLQGKTISTADGWVRYEGTYRYSSVGSEFITIYVESSNNATASFYIDDISFEPTGSGSTEIQKDLKPIRDAYQDDFLIGNAISAEDMEGVRLELLKMHHNAATAGNAMKPGSLQPTKGNFDFTAADELVGKVLAEGLKMHGHVLVWHQQTGAWMNTKEENGNTVYLGREEALENMRTHIKTVMEHFGDKVISWDVVNEAMNDNPPNPADWKASLRQSPWYYAVGPDYVEQAFLAAREVLDSHPEWGNIALYYNDYNDDNQNKSKAIYNMVKELNGNYSGTHPGKLLIDGIGMQGHYTVSTNPANVELSLERFISLGVKVSITELDIQAGSNSQLPENLAKAQGYLYAQLFRIFKAHAQNIERVTFWGMDDGTSWRSSTNPTLFDKNLQAKPAYYGVIDPEKFMAENEPSTPPDANRSTAVYGTPVIDGTTDAVWNGVPAMQINRYQMAWQGANGTAKALWDEKNLYVLIQVSDAQLDKVSANVWEQDSVEAFVDENNGKTSFYQEDDGQYRVNFDNEASFNPAGIADGFESATSVSGTNYTVEMKIPFKTITPANNVKLGFDAQINDAKDGARQSVAAWNDTTGNGYQDTSVYGVLTLTGKKTSGGESTGTGGGSPTGGSGATISGQAGRTGRAEVTVKAPAAVNSDGNVTVNITDRMIEEILEQIRALKQSGENDGAGTQAGTTVTLILPASAAAGTVRLPDDALSRILAADGKASLKIVCGLWNVEFDSKALETISRAGAGSTEISVSRLDAAAMAKLPPEAAEKIAGRPAYEFRAAKGGARVTGFNGGKVTAVIKYAPAEGEDPNAVLVYRIDGENLIPVLRSSYENGAVRFETDHFSGFAAGYNKVGFDDVGPDDDDYAPITYLAAREIIAGSSFEPKRGITRGEGIVMLMKAYDIQPLANPADNFSDAAGDYAGYYAKAKAAGISDGVGNNRIGADIPLTREMLYTLICNILGSTGGLPAADTPVRELSSFSDCDQLSNWSVEAVAKLAAAGMFQDADSNALRPKSALSRGEAAAVICRLLSRNKIG